MTRSVRALSMTIGFLLLLHFGVMAVDPMAMHAGVEVQASTLKTHENHAAHTGHESTMSVETCIEAEGVAPQSRVPLDPVAFIAVISSSVDGAVPAELSFHSNWSPPVLDGKDIRVLLQVFLN